MTNSVFIWPDFYLVVLLVGAIYPIFNRILVLVLVLLYTEIFFKNT